MSLKVIAVYLQANSCPVLWNYIYGRCPEDARYITRTRQRKQVKYVGNLQDTSPQWVLIGRNELPLVVDASPQTWTFSYTRQFMSPDQPSSSSFSKIAKPGYSKVLLSPG